MCCSNGKVKLPPLNQPPDALLPYVRKNFRIKTFPADLRRYNSCFQMTSFGAPQQLMKHALCLRLKCNAKFITKLDQWFSSHIFLRHYPLRIMWSFWKFSLWVTNNYKPINAEKNIPGTGRGIVLNLQRFLHQHNYLVNMFKTALDRMQTD